MTKEREIVSHSTAKTGIVAILNQLIQTDRQEPEKNERREESDER